MKEIKQYLYDVCQILIHTGIAADLWGNMGLLAHPQVSHNGKNYQKRLYDSWNNSIPFEIYSVIRYKKLQML